MTSMIPWIDALLPYARGVITRRPIVIPSTEDEWERLNTGLCMACGAEDELSYYLCWACVKERNGL